VRREEGRLRRGALGQLGRARGLDLQVRGSGLSGFRSWNGVERHELFPGVRIKAIGGEQLLLCEVVYEPGFGVESHSHEHTEQVMVVTDGEMTLTIAGETRTLTAGDTAVINRGVEHSVRSERGCRFIEALAPVPLDHVPDRERDLVLGPDGGSGHVER
jgi:quercetin dioxygenase-like cupin family protein